MFQPRDESQPGFPPAKFASSDFFPFLKNLKPIMEIRPANLASVELAALLEEHLRDMNAVSPPESKHALDLAGLGRSEITMWSVWNESVLVGCGALKELSASEGEIKSMRTAAGWRGRGVGSLLLQHILEEAGRRGYQRVSLETGSMGFFQPAHRLYAKFGFAPCGPFGGYREDPNSLFFTKVLAGARPWPS